MKTKEELQQLKNEYEELSNNLNELSEEEIKIVTGGHGKNGKPTIVLWDETSSGLINDPDGLK